MAASAGDHQSVVTTTTLRNLVLTIPNTTTIIIKLDVEVALLTLEVRDSHVAEASPLVSLWHKGNYNRFFPCFACESRECILLVFVVQITDCCSGF